MLLKATYKFKNYKKNKEGEFYLTPFTVINQSYIKSNKVFIFLFSNQDFAVSLDWIPKQLME
jgi:hypothetical protein